ncbi:MAG: DUF2157 domain-containing protein [Candidatus Spyradosoma sp.]
MKYSEIRNLAELGLITPEQADAVAAHFRLSPREPRNHLLIAFSALGGLLVLAGVVMLVSANWEAIPPLARQISCAALMVAFWAAGLRFLLRKNPRPFVGEALCFVGAGTWLANIALYGQIYQISSEPSRAFGAWFLGIFLLPWCVRLRGVFAMSLFAALLCLACLVDEARAGEAAFHYFIAFFTGVSALGVFLGGLGEKARERVRGYGPIALWTAFPALILIAQFFCHDELEASAGTACALVPAGALFVASLLFSFRKKLGAAGAVFATLVGAFPFVPLALGFWGCHSDFDTAIHVTMMLSLFVCGAAAMGLGAIVSRRFFVNAGALMILLAALALTVEVVGSLTSSGLALILAGALLLAFGFFLERQRRRLTRNIREAATGDA